MGAGPVSLLMRHVGTLLAFQTMCFKNVLSLPQLLPDPPYFLTQSVHVLSLSLSKQISKTLKKKKSKRQKVNTKAKCPQNEHEVHLVIANNPWAWGLPWNAVD